jgi:hypothetical protein
VLFLGYMVVFLGVWEFWGGGDFLEVYYYFSMFLVPVAFALPAIVYLFARVARTTISIPLTIALTAVAATPVLILYGLRVGPVDRSGFYLVAALMGWALVAAAFPRLPHPRIVATVTALGLCLVVGATGYAGASGYTPRSVFGATGSREFNERRAALSMAIQLIDFVRASGLQDKLPPPNFWYDGHKYPPLNGIQSTYLWGITWIGREMPHVSRAVRSALETRKPGNLVLLCGTPDCAGGPAALERAGYRLRLRAQTVIASRGERYWVKAFRLPKFRELDPKTAWWAQSESTFGTAVAGRGIERWSLRTGLPQGWSSDDELSPAGDSTALTTTSRKWNYEVVSAAMTLPPGTYGVYLRGKVLAGGLDLGVLDDGANRWIEQRTYWYGQSGFDRGWMTTPFRLNAATKVKFILSNWVPRDMSSRWQLKELRLVRTP